MNEASLDIQKLFYHPICNAAEIERIFNIKNSKDYLLKIRADTIVDHMRLFRVYRNKALFKGNEWSLEDSFSAYHFIQFKNKLPNELRIKCNEVEYGNIFSNEANGLIFPSDFGIICTLSDSLCYFFEFMNLGLLYFGTKVPQHIQINAVRIALRVMLQTESLDFLMDPRGIIPVDICKKMHLSIPFQMQFIAGHEYSHFLLDHLSDENKIKKFIFRAVFKSQSDYSPLDVFNTSQKEELEADVSSINLPQYNLQEKILVFEAALIWFACLYIYEGVVNSIFPPSGFQSHPSAKYRYFNLLEKIETHPDFNVS